MSGIVITYFEEEENIANHYRIINKLSMKSTDDNIGLTSFFLPYKRLQEKDKLWPDIVGTCPLAFSKRGAEAWIIPSKLKDEKMDDGEEFSVTRLRDIMS